MIEFRDVTVTYPQAEQPAVEKVSFHVPVHGFLFITGESGAGKTTILRLITKELEPTEGDILINGKSICKMKRKEIPMYRRRIGFVSQEVGLLENKTVYENVELVKRVVGAKSDTIRIQVAMALKTVGMEAYYQCYPRELSGGQRKKVCIARAIANHPDILLADEPTGDLDPESSLEIMSLFSELHSHGMTVLVVTHDKEAVEKLQYPQMIITEGQASVVE